MKKPFRLQFQVLSDFRYLPFLSRIFKVLKVPDSHSLTQILVEAYNNAVIHAHRRNKHKWIGIELRMGPGKTSIRIVDSGPGLKKNLETRKDTPWKTSGRGLGLIQAKADKISSKKSKDCHVFEAIRYHA